MRAGSLDRIITIRRADAERFTLPDEHGVTHANPEAPITMRAELQDAEATDIAHEAGHMTKTRWTFRLRFLPRINPGDQLTYDKRQFEIVAVKEIGRRKGLELIAEERPR